MPDPATSETQPPAATPAPIKPGIKTTEFWFNILIAAVNALILSDVLVPGSQAMKVVAVVALTLQGLGYNVMRVKAKKKAGETSSGEAGHAVLDIMAGLAIAGGAAVMIAAIAGAGCSGAKATGRHLVGTAVDCAAPAALEATKQYGPAVEQLLQRSTSSEGQVDVPSLEQATVGFLADTGWCVVENVAASFLSRLPLPGAPQSSPLSADPEELKRALGAIRASRYGGKTFKPAVGSP